MQGDFKLAAIHEKGLLDKPYVCICSDGIEIPSISLGNLFFFVLQAQWFVLVTKDHSNILGMQQLWVFLHMETKRE